MGKYMKKPKITGEVAVMEVSLSPQCSLGVRTRAKTLALQRQQQQQQQQQRKSPTSNPNPVDSSAFSYLELRSRRLEKPPLLSEAKKQNKEKQGSPPVMTTRDCCGEKNPRTKFRWRSSRLSDVRSLDSGLADETLGLKGDETEEEEASFGENNSDFQGRDSTRESTPSSLIRESDILRNPGSTTRRPSSTATNQRVRNGMQRNIPTAQEIEEFFAFAEQQQQRIFIEKYNFDITIDSPLPGRYEWVQVVP
ncbi:hypothetical protein CsatB_024924 [Cannabis sativa]|uniref:cyclin-dependent kinase inhibitor 3 n=1 Tax=Cannabis sativa TaxID=3483 RepID=UPI0029CA0CF0|nr:cyclin-dependent kinase inhibitor 3 [Cannabis sativa]